MVRWLILLSLATASAQAQTPAPPPQPCAAPEYRQFDFWLGDWDVTQAGAPAGSNRIESLHGGCVLAENWRSANGSFTGSSLNAYDRGTGRWRQTWTDSSGTVLLLAGGLEDSRMVMSGTRSGPDGQDVTDRITWTPNEDGSVRQHWQQKTAGGDWSTLFDGLYVRVKQGE